MNIHEYQAKELLQKFGVATPAGKAARTAEEAEAFARELGTEDLVVKAQVHAGGRGKGTFTNGFKGGVHLCKSPTEAREIAGKMLGQTLVTHQTGAAGRVVNTILVAKSVEIEREVYFAILVDRATGGPMIVASTEGGVEIEAVAEKSPEKILREPVDRLAGLQPYQARKLAKQLGFTSEQIKPAAKLFDGLYRTFLALDCSMVEVNPLVVTDKGEVLALDAKFNFDDNALYRHADVAAMRDTAEEDPREVEASKYGLNYIGLDGNIACLVNGAGLGHGHDGHHQILRRQPGQLPRCRWRRDGGAGDAGVQAFGFGRERESHPGEHFWRDHEVRRHRPGHRQRGEGGKLAGAVGRSAGRHERGRREEDHRRFWFTGDDGGRSRGRGAEGSESRAREMKVNAIAFVGVPVTEMKRARDFYEGVLGLTADPEMTGERWTEYQIGGGTLALGCIGNEWQPSDKGTNFALEVDDLDEALARLDSRQVAFSRWESPVCWMAGLQDPDGNRLIIHKLKSESEQEADA